MCTLRLIVREFSTSLTAHYVVMLDSTNTIKMTNNEYEKAVGVLCSCFIKN